ncbi:24057_t:CDS:1, partial [Gigaspora rosea]
KCNLSKATGRKPIWFEEFEQIILEGPSTQKIKPKCQWDMINTLAPRAELLKISIGKQKMMNQRTRQGSKNVKAAR